VGTREQLLGGRRVEEEGEKGEKSGKGEKMKKNLRFKI
jgi:hypothetical protein